MKPTLREIQLAVAAYYGIDADALTSNDRRRDVAWPRQMAQHLSRSLSGKSFWAIAAYYNRDHSTVQYANAIVPKRIQLDRATWAAHHRLKRRLKDIAARRHDCCSQELAA